MARRRFEIGLGLLLLVLCLAQPLTAAGEKGASDARRRSAAKKALDYLAGKQLTHPSGPNGLTVTHALAGLAYLAAGSTLKKGDYRQQLNLCLKEVLANTGKKSFNPNKTWNQTTWGYAHAMIFLAELQARKKDAQIKRALELYAGKLKDYQGQDGGWCHGPWSAGPNALGYRQFTAPTILCLIALGYARKVGVKVDQKVIDRGIQYLKDSSGTDGGVGYSPKSGQKGHGYPGRNGGAVVAFIAAGKGKDKFLPRMVNYMNKDYAKMEAGHGSAVLHLMEGALAAIVLGVKSWDRFWVGFSESILKRQKANGEFPPPKGDIMAQKMGPGMEAGDRCTATHALILLLPDCRLKLLSGLSNPQGEKSYARVRGKGAKKALAKAVRLVASVAKLEAKETNAAKRFKLLATLYFLTQDLALEDEFDTQVKALTETVTAKIKEAQQAVRAALAANDMKAALQLIKEQKKPYASTGGGTWFKEAEKCARFKETYLKFAAQKEAGKKIGKSRHRKAVESLEKKMEKLKTPEWSEWVQELIGKLRRLL